MLDTGERGESRLTAGHPIRGVAMALVVLLLLNSCAEGAKPGAPLSEVAPRAIPSLASSVVTALPRPMLPAFYIESLRARGFPGGKLEVGRQLFRGAGFTKYEMTWPSDGQVMTGTIAIPDGPGPFPVVLVNHGFIPTSRYYAGADSDIYGDPMAAHGFIAVAPNYPGYTGSGPGRSDMPQMVATAVSVMDLVGSLATVPRADPARVAMVGHSFGGGVSLIVMVVDSRVRAFALYGPVSSDMRDSARKWWLRLGSAPPLGDPDANPEGYAHISPRYYFDFARAPALILQGTLDEDIPAGWTTSTVEALQAKEAQVSLVWFPGASHNFGGADLAAANAMAETWIRQAFKICTERCGPASRSLLIN